MKDTKEKLLEATFRLISEKGYLGATTREIAYRAGVTELTLFRHFGSKEKLFEEVLKKYTFLPRLKGLLPELIGMCYNEALEILGERFIETLKERKSLIRIMLSEINLYPDKIRVVYNGFIDELIKTLAGYFRFLQKGKILRHFPSETAARAFLGMIFSYFLSQEIMVGRVVDKKEARRVLKDFIGIFMKGTLQEESSIIGHAKSVKRKTRLKGMRTNG